MPNKIAGAKEMARMEKESGRGQPKVKSERAKVSIPNPPRKKRG